MLDPKPITIIDRKGKERTYILHRIPAIAGREIMHKYPISNVPKLGDYEISRETMLKLMKYVGVYLVNDGRSEPLVQMLDSELLVDSHVYDATDLLKLEKEMLGYNFDFFQGGWLLTFLEEYTRNQLPRVLKTLMGLLAQSLQVAKQP